MKSPAAALAHDIGAEEFFSNGLNGLLEQDAAAVEIEIAEPFVDGRAGAVVGARCRGEPALGDAAAMGPERIEVAGVELEASSRHEERTGDPAGSEAHDAAPLVEGFAD